MVASSNRVRLLFWAICLSSPTACSACREAKLCTGLLTAAKITRHLLTVYQTRFSLNIYRQMALFEMVQTLILRFANMKKWINSLNLSTLIFQTLQYVSQIRRLLCTYLDSKSSLAFVLHLGWNPTGHGYKTANVFHSHCNADYASWWEYYV